jgi:peptidase S41-like protein
MRAKTLTQGAFLLVFAVVAAAPTEGARGQDDRLGRPKWPIRSGPGAAIQRGGAERLTRPTRGRALGAHPSPDWCSHVLGGPRGQRDFRVDLSVAQATTREFSMGSVFGVSDAALAQALHIAGPLQKNDVEAVLQGYADSLDDVCATRARPDQLGRARVQKIGPVAYVVPGTGQPQLPPGTELVVMDLRDLPAVDDLDAALASAVAPVLAAGVVRPARWRRAHYGPIDEVFASPNVYSTFVGLDERGRLAVSGSRDLPFVLLTSDRMAPRAAAFAGTLRMAQRAWIAGADIYSEVAEADWRGVDKQGLAIRTEFFDQLSRPGPPEQLHDQVVTQDDPNDPTTATYRRDLIVPDGTRLVDLSTHDASGAIDLDLFLLYDANGDGAFTFPDELVAYSAGPTGDERIRLIGTPNPPGHYQLWAHGWFIPQGTAPFDLTIDVATGQLWPDRIPADVRLGEGSGVNVVADVLPLLGSHPGPVTGPAARSFPDPVDPFGVGQPVVTGKAEMRASLLIAHGITRLFFPYFDVVGDRIDSRLLETLASVEDWDGADRTAAFNLLRRFGEALHDGHQFVFDGGPVTYGYLPVFLEEIGGRPVVRRSAIPEIRAGDTILSMDGRPIEEVYAEQYRFTSTATHGYQFDVASRFVSRLTHPTVLELADPGGAIRRVTIAPQSRAAYLAAVLPGVSSRPSGPLGDLGAPNLYYLNMDAEASPSEADVRAAIADAVARGATGMVLDMRGYPGGDHYEVAQRLIRAAFLSPQFWIPFIAGPDSEAEYRPSQYAFGPLGPPAWSRPIVLLTGPHAVSAAENFMQMLVGAHRLTAIVGERRSAGTNGNITGVQLPGGFGFSYTGMRVLNPDGSRHHGVGIVPDVETSLSAADLRDGVDRDLLAAIDVLAGP